MVTVRGTLARILYAFVFVILVPALLFWWAGAAAANVPLVPVRAPLPGLAVAGIGVLLMLAGITALVRHGGGLPMNAFPPPRLVEQGVFGIFGNPIYVGFTLTSAGLAIASGSAAGLWLVTPVAALAATALVQGYERHDLAARFGTAPRGLALPADDDSPVTTRDRAAVVLRVLVPWLIVYAAAQALGRAPDRFGTITGWERRWPVVQWTEIIYASTYLFVPLTVLTESSRRRLRALATEGRIGTAVVGFCWLIIPVVADNRPFVPDGTWGRWLAFEQGHSAGVAAFPAFHVLWAVIAGAAWAGAGGGRRTLGIAWAAAIVVSCLTTGMHTLVEVAAGLAVWPPIRHHRAVWACLRHRAEQLANGWREWRIGPVRIINHGFFAGAGAGIGLLVAGAAAGRQATGTVTWVAAWILAGAGAWAQWLEGSSRLLRPFGWYGGMLGGFIGALLARMAGAPLLPLLAAFAIAAPWIQLFGRMRCLVQGCCHGGPAPVEVGIRYRHRRSRVTQVAGLRDVPIHPTPLYSIMANLVIGIVLLRLRILGAADPLVLGLYLILGGLARFVEESYRAEPQTPVIGGLRVYQWLAVVSFAVGIWCTTLPGAAASGPLALPDLRLLAAAVVMAIITTAAMGVDFPGSDRRFSRLAPADD